MEFPDILKKLRESQDITQDMLAKHLHVSRSTIAGYETGRREPDYARLVNLSGFFHVSIDYLLTGSEYEPDQADAVYRLEPLPLADPNVVKAYRSLSPIGLKEVHDYIEFMSQKEGK